MASQPSCELFWERFVDTTVIEDIPKKAAGANRVQSTPRGYGSY